MSGHEQLSRTTIVFHWLVAAALIAMIGFGLYVESVPSGPDKTALIQVHKSFGVVVGALVLVRIIWRLREGFPAPVAAVTARAARLARATHVALLTLALMMPVAGIMASLTYARPVKVFGLPFIPQVLDEKNEAWNEFFSAAHGMIAYALAALILAHAGAALHHHYRRGDRTLLRMLGR